MADQLINQLDELITAVAADLFIIEDADTSTKVMKISGSNVRLLMRGGLTASRAVETNASGVIISSAITATELGYLNNVNANIRIHIDAYNTHAANVTTIHMPNQSGKAGSYLSTDGSIASWQTFTIGSTDIDDFAITASKVFNNIPIISEDNWTDDDPTAGKIAWDEHNITYGGAYYLIAAGNTSSALHTHVYWDVPGAPSGQGTVDDPYLTTYASQQGAPTMTDTRFVIATNISGQHNVAWNSIANSVIGTAHILDASIINAKINDLSANKINAGTLTGRTVQTAASGVKRIVISGANNNITLLDSSDNELLVIDDNVFASKPGILMDESGIGGIIHINDGTKSINMNPSGVSYFQGCQLNFGISPVKMSLSESGAFLDGVDIVVTGGGNIETSGIVQANTSFNVGATVIVDSSRNLTNIGTINCGSITTSGTVDGVDIAARDHAESHTIGSHPATTETNGHVLVVNSGAWISGTLSFAGIAAASHTHTHASTTGRTANDHHAQSHAHSSHTGLTTDNHHAQIHTLGSHSNVNVNVDSLGLPDNGEQLTWNNTASEWVSDTA